MRRVLYMAHPVAPTPEEIADTPSVRVHRGRGEYEADWETPIDDATRFGWAVRRNLDRAQRWLSWLRRSFPETTFIAPWISSILAGADGHDPNQREQGLIDDCAVIERCDGIVLCGPRISAGMARERDHFRAALRDRALRQTTDWGLSAAAMMYGMSSPAAALTASSGQSIGVYDLTGYQIEGESGRNPDGRSFEQWMLGYQESCTR